MKKLVLFCSALLALVCFAPLLVHGQPPPVDPDPGVPIDGGLTLLAGAAIAYGAKKLKGKKKQQIEK